MATLLDVAKAAKVSANTVSRVLHGDIDYQRPTFAKRAQRIKLLAERMGYQPNAYARAVRSGRFGAITLLLSSNAYRSNLPIPLLDGVHDALHARDMHLMIARLPDDKITSEGYVPRILREHGSDGLLINYTDHIPRKMLDIVEKNRLPSVWLNAQMPGACVYPDEIEAAHRLTTHLIKQGHRRIAYVQCSDFDAHYSTRERSEGYRQAMREAGLDACVMGNLDQRHLAPEEVRPVRRKLKGSLAEAFRRQRITAVVAYAEVEAMLAMRASEALGLTPGSQFMVGAFAQDYLEYDQVVLPTMIVPNRRMGQLAIELLNDAIAKTKAPLRRIAVRHTFVFDESLLGTPNAADAAEE